MDGTKREYYESLLRITEFLIEKKQHAEYVLNFFYQQENYEMEEILNAEGDITFHQKLEFKMLAKKKQMDKIKTYLTSFKNEKFKTKCAEYIYWIHYVLDPPTTFKVQPFPAELKTLLSHVKRFDDDIFLLCEELNRRFKTISLTSGTPAP